MDAKHLRRPLLSLGLVITLSGLCLAGQTLIEQSLAKLESSPPPSPDSFDFIVMADSNSLKPLVQTDIFRGMIREFNLWKPSFVIEAGDIILGGSAEGVPKQWDLFGQVIQELETPYFPTPGNHDISDPATENIWTARIGPTYYAFRYGNSLFVSLNTEAQDAVQNIPDKQVTWLSNLLDHTEAKNIFIYLHRPLFTNLGDPDNDDTLWDKHWSNVAETFEGHPVRAVFAGHKHVYRDCGIRDGVRYVICGGASTYGMDGKEEEGSFNHYLIVRVRGDEFKWTVIKPNAVLPPDYITRARIGELYNIRNKWIHAEELEVPLGEPADNEIKITIKNTSDGPLRSCLSWQRRSAWTIFPKSTDYKVAAHSSTDLCFRIKSDKAQFPVPFFSTTYEQTQHGPAVDIRQDLKLIPTIKAAHAANGVILDGVLDEWQSVQMVPLVYPVNFKESTPEDLTAELGFMWDDDYLYLAVQTLDNEHHQPYAGDIVWSADNVELFLGDWSWGLTLTKNGPEAFMYWGVDEAGNAVNSDVKLAVRRENTKTTYEALFPQSLLTPLQLSQGNSFKVNMLMNDLDPSGPKKGRHWLQLVPEKSAEGGPKPKIKVVLQK
jgi:cellulose/xylan binding protein with CBM9 domain/calcineurin-like phosphoesterase family protein